MLDWGAGWGAHNHVICSLKALQTTRHDLEKNGIAAHCRVRQKALLKKKGICAWDMLSLPGFYTVESLL
jgi:hypothetical protein